MSRRILLVSFFYPPDPAVGGRRVAKFAHYLPAHGWEPAALTARRYGVAPGPEPVHATRYLTPWRLPPEDAEPGAEAAAPRLTLRERLATGPLRRAAYRALRHVVPMSSVRMPDATLGWVPFAVWNGRRLLADGDFDAILSSAGPPSSHIVASRLQRASGLPWIADYRDLWSDNHWDRRVAAFRWLERRLERRILRRASLLTTVTSTWARQLVDLHGRRTEVIHNGFDPHDYPTEVEATHNFTITYVGTLYYPQQNPGPLLAALALAAGRRDVDLSDVGFELRFLGTPPGVVGPLAERHGVGRWVRVLPPVSHRESLRHQMASTALLFVGWDPPEGGPLTAKMYEYLGAGRPIVSVGPPGGPASDLLQECGYPGSLTNPERIADLLVDWIDTFGRTGHLPTERNEEAVARYTRDAQTARLARLLDGLVD